MPNGMQNMGTGMRQGSQANGRNSQRMQNAQNRGAQAAPTEMAEFSPLKALASRIRQEQGAKGLSDFIGAMVPFAAPNELNSIAESFGMDVESILERKRRVETPPPPPPEKPAENRGNDQLLQLFQIMQLMNGLNGFSGVPGGAGSGAKAPGAGKGPDPMQLMRMMQLMPMLQSMMGGSPQGAPDLSSIMKMMGG